LYAEIYSIKKKYNKKPDTKFNKKNSMLKVLEIKLAKQKHKKCVTLKIKLAKQTNYVRPALFNLEEKNLDKNSLNQEL
jgi:hypothetical protein